MQKRTRRMMATPRDNPRIASVVSAADFCKTVYNVAGRIKDANATARGARLL
jgi:hypothetical protein